MSEEIKIKEQFHKENNKALWITGVIIAIFVLGLITNGFGLFNKNPNDNPTSDIQLSIGNSPVLGNENAPITIYEFSDFSCPYCAAANGKNPAIISQFKSSNPNWEAPIPSVIEDYVNTGKAKIVFKYASGHGTGRAAHIVALALNEQELFWKFSDLAFQNQEDTEDLVKMKALAEQLGANMTKLESDIANNNYDALLSLDEKMAEANGVTGTPTFFINGKKIDGAASFSEFKKIIDSKL